MAITLLVSSSTGTTAVIQGLSEQNSSKYQSLLTAGFAVLAMLLLLFVPTPLRVLKHNLDNKSIGQQLADVLKIGDLKNAAY